MKKLLILTIAVTMVTACKKSDFQPTDAEKALIGDWKLNATETYTNGMLSQTISHTDAGNCHLELKATEYKGQEGAINCENGLSCQPVDSWWKLEGDLLNVGSIQYNIITHTATTLVIQKGDPASSYGAYKYYLTM